MGEGDSVNAEFEKWLEGRPEIVKELALKFPPGTRIIGHDARVMHVVSYDESGGLGVSAVNPFEDYDGALASREMLCKCCLERAREIP